MVVGNPYKFSIFIEIIEAWNYKDDISSFRNGIFLFCIDGELYPRQVVTATLNVDIPFLENALLNLPIDKKIFNMVKEEAFLEMYNINFRETDSDNTSYYISPPILADCNCIAFGVSDGNQVRIMAAKMDYIQEISTHDFNNIEISEAIILHTELNEMILKMGKVLQP